MHQTITGCISEPNRARGTTWRKPPNTPEQTPAVALLRCRFSNGQNRKKLFALVGPSPSTKFSMALLKLQDKPQTSKNLPKGSGLYLLMPLQLPTSIPELNNASIKTFHPGSSGRRCSRLRAPQNICTQATQGDRLVRVDRRGASTPRWASSTAMAAIAP